MLHGPTNVKFKCRTNCPQICNYSTARTRCALLSMPLATLCGVRMIQFSIKHRTHSVKMQHNLTQE